MFIPFKDLPDSSRIWIYQSNRELNEDEVNEIKKFAENFVGEWTAHQQTLHAGFEIFHNIFLILSVDENRNDASGCSIDKSVHFIRQLESHFKISLFDRFNIAFRNEDKVEVKTLNDFLKIYKDKKLTNRLPVFNNLLFTKADLKTKWEIPLNESWVKLRVKN
ncbi:MAG: ABC transporter ATPase [Bacteroidota bacterium]